MNKTRDYETINGYFLEVGRVAIFLESDATKRTNKTARDMINAIGTTRGLCPEMIKHYQNDVITVKRIQHDMAPASLTVKHTDGMGMWYAVSGQYFGGGYNPDEITIYRRIRKGA